MGGQSFFSHLGLTHQLQPPLRDPHVGIAVDPSADQTMSLSTAGSPAMCHAASQEPTANSLKLALRKCPSACPFSELLHPFNH